MDLTCNRCGRNECSRKLRYNEPAVFESCFGNITFDFHGMTVCDMLSSLPIIRRMYGERKVSFIVGRGCRSKDQAVLPYYLENWLVSQNIGWVFKYGKYIPGRNFPMERVQHHGRKNFERFYRL